MKATLRKLYAHVCTKKKKVIAKAMADSEAGQEAVMLTLLGQQRDSVTAVVQRSDDDVHIVELTLFHTHTQQTKDKVESLPAWGGGVVGWVNW